MGLMVSVVAGALSALLFAVFGTGLWVAVVVAVLWVCALAAAAIGGHRAFRTGANTDLPLVVLGFGILAPSGVEGPLKSPGRPESSLDFARDERSHEFKRARPTPASTTARPRTPGRSRGWGPGVGERAGRLRRPGRDLLQDIACLTRRPVR